MKITKAERLPNGRVKIVRDFGSTGSTVVLSVDQLAAMRDLFNREEEAAPAEEEATDE